MKQFTEGDRVRIDIPNETDVDHDRYHGEHGTIVDVLRDDAGSVTGKEQDSYIIRVQLDSGETADLRSRNLRPPID